MKRLGFGLINKMSAMDRLRSATPQLTLLLLLLSAILLGRAFADDYGSSTDEPANAIVGRDALKAFRDPLGYLDYLDEEHKEVLAHHGPSYFMLFSAASRLFQDIFPGWHIADGRHLTNYLTHLLGAIGFYHLARRLLDWQYAAMAAVFFFTQPMLLGHGFINQKDTPFMAFFVLSVVTGIVASDRVAAATRNGQREGKADSFLRAIASDWASLSKSWKAALLLMTGTTLLIVADVLVLENGLRWGQEVLTLAHRGEAWEPINRLFLAVAEDARTAALDVYQFRLQWMFWRARMVLIGLALLPVLILAGWLMPGSARHLWKRYRGALLWVLLAAVLMGFTISIRPVGGFAGVLVSLYWLRKSSTKSIGLLAIYWLWSGATMYMTWPFIWPAPLQLSLESLAYTGGFDKVNLYLGERVYSKSLPWHYFPVLATLELTEPTMPLILLGTGVTLWRWRRENWDPDLLLVLALWFGLPIFGLLVFRFSVYGNIRHLLFVLVPMLLMAGVAIGSFLRRLPRWWMQLGLYGLLLVPALLGILQLHPYEYGYFNLYAGGIERASHNFLLDRWCTSYREAMQYVNERAHRNAVISPTYSDEVATPFARTDLFMSDRDVDALPNAAYHLTCAFFVGGQGYTDPGTWYRVHTVGRGGAVLAEVYRQLTIPPWAP